MRGFASICACFAFLIQAAQAAQEQPKPASQCPLHALYSTAPSETSYGARISSFLFGPMIQWFRPEPNPSVPVVELGDKNNIFKGISQIQELGPDRFFYAASAKTSAPISKVRVGPRWLYLVQESEQAQTLLDRYGRNLGRGHELGPFKEMVGDVFFAKDGPAVSEGRRVFYKSVSRNTNFGKIREVVTPLISEAVTLADQGKLNLYEWSFQYVIAGIAKTFIGVEDINTIPKDAYATFMNAAPQIIHAGIDPLSRTLGPTWRSDFVAAQEQMKLLSYNLLHQNLDAISSGGNYVWDLALLRAKTLYPERDFLGCEEKLPRSEQQRTLECQAMIRDLIANDPWVREHGPMTAFASMNVGRSLFYVLDQLGQHPEIVTKIRQEIDEALGDRPMLPGDVLELSYLRAVISEALWQLTPIPSFPREVLTSFEFRRDQSDPAISFSQGDIIVFLFKPIQGKPREFSPDLWLGDNTQRPQLWAFGHGGRRCPAESFAFQLIEQLVVQMLQQNIQIAPNRSVDYTTRFGGLGPDYHSEDPIRGSVIPLGALR